MNARGHTLVELMIALALAALVSVGVIGLFAQQSGLLRQEARLQQGRQEGAYLFDLLATLLRQAQAGSVRIRIQPAIPPTVERAEGTDDRITIDLLLPAGVPVWPNLDGQRPAVRLQWRREDGRLWLATASDPAALDGAPLRPLRGQAPATPLLDLDLWPLDANLRPQPTADAPAPGGYRLALLFPGADAAHRHAHSGLVAPRN